ncbi:hypothetical protein ABZX75_17320 [Streptomyces sp. NPDC003038]|uniref:hypothetical protein n=1 Tax=unclassified Streptomyces TaxID=2593676 RepID=UPI0033BF616B
MTQTDTVTTPAPEQAGGPLPPYSGRETLCAKCSNLEAYTRFQPAIGHPRTEEYNGRLERRGPLPERLERQCERCDYQWDEALNPAPGVRPATVQEIAYALQQSHAGWALDLSPECAQYMAGQLAEMLHLLVRLDHPMWLPRPGRPLRVPPTGPLQPGATLTAAVPIPLQERPDTANGSKS